MIRLTMGPTHLSKWALPEKSLFCPRLFLEGFSGKVTAGFNSLCDLPPIHRRDVCGVVVKG